MATSNYSKNKLHTMSLDRSARNSRKISMKRAKNCEENLTKCLAVTEMYQAVKTYFKEYYRNQAKAQVKGFMNNLSINSKKISCYGRLGN